MIPKISGSHKPSGLIINFLELLVSLVKCKEVIKKVSSLDIFVGCLLTIFPTRLPEGFVDCVGVEENDSTFDRMDLFSTLAWFCIPIFRERMTVNMTGSQKWDWKERKLHPQRSSRNRMTKKISRHTFGTKPIFQTFFCRVEISWVENIVTSVCMSVTVSHRTYTMWSFPKFMSQSDRNGRTSTSNLPPHTGLHLGNSNLAKCILFAKTFIDISFHTCIHSCIQNTQ